jgi:hypothetical protein
VVGDYDIRELTEAKAFAPDLKDNESKVLAQAVTMGSDPIMHSQGKLFAGSLTSIGHHCRMERAYTRNRAQRFHLLTLLAAIVDSAQGSPVAEPRSTIQMTTCE